MAFHVPEQYRVLVGNKEFGNNGVFKMGKLIMVASDGGGWEHVSASFKDRCPKWQEMCTIKDLFWDKTDCVIQYHPAEEDYVNNHPYCLHLWRPTDVSIPKPPKSFV